MAVNGFHHSIILEYIRNFIFAMYCFFRRVFGESYPRLLYIITLVVIINELIISLLYIWSWPDKNCGQLKNLSTVLLVGDPQILGENRDSWIARWDCDRFLHNWFAAALRYSQPDVIIFLGDFMEEGSSADDEEFTRYVSRFKWIFQRGNIPTILVPGSCDYGLNRSLIERFNKFFDPLEDLERFENLEFYKAKTVLEKFPNISSIAVNSSTVRIALNDVSFLGFPSTFTEQVVRDLRPQLILTANHKSVHLIGNRETGETIAIQNHDDLLTWKFENKKMITNEIVVPTCSYRMGEPKIGYGLAVIDKEGLFSCYMVLWIPQRLHHLIIYLCLTVLIFIYSIVPFLFRNGKYLIRKFNKQLTSYRNRRSV